ncbi:MAG TPA: DUF6265 family protein [Candidatus Sulfotelmatobacter sp.]|nr:DUF6265 family protein [Candidatus Sulfotelmatobacter sp.]
MKSPQPRLGRRLACGIVFFLGGLQSAAMPQQPAGAGAGAQTASAPPAVPAPATVVPDSTQPKASIADFSWLEGRWQGTWGPRVAEQTWLAPKAGTMLGTFRLVENEKVLVLELFTLVQKPEGIDFYFRHFTPELVPWEKTDATILKLASLDANRADFENPVNGQPKHSILTRVDADTYTLRSEIVPEQGDPQTIEITYHRVKSPEAKPNAGNAGRR